MNLDICKSLLIFETVISYFNGINYDDIMRLDFRPYLIRKIKMLDIRHEHHTKCSLSNYNIQLKSKYFCISISLHIRSCDPFKSVYGIYNKVSKHTSYTKLLIHYSMLLNSVE